MSNGCPQSLCAGRTHTRLSVVVTLDRPHLQRTTLKCHCFGQHGLVRTSINVLNQMLQQTPQGRRQGFYWSLDAGIHLLTHKLSVMSCKMRLISVPSHTWWKNGSLPLFRKSTCTFSDTVTHLLGSIDETTENNVIWGHIRRSKLGPLQTREIQLSPQPMLMEELWYLCSSLWAGAARAEVREGVLLKAEPQRR